MDNIYIESIDDLMLSGDSIGLMPDTNYIIKPHIRMMYPIKRKVKRFNKKQFQHVYLQRGVGNEI